MSWQDLPGYFDWQSTYTRWVTEAPKNATIVEIGVLFGRSLAFLASEAIRLGRDDLTLVGVVPWPDGVDWIEREFPETRGKGAFFWAFNEGFETHAPAEYRRVRICRTTSKEALRIALAYGWVGKVWGVYLDGDHAAESVSADIAAWLPLIAPGGELAGHDFGGPHTGVEEAVTAKWGRWENNPHYRLEGSTWIHKVK